MTENWRYCQHCMVRTPHHYNQCGTCGRRGPLVSGDVFFSNCGRCRRTTRHVWQPGTASPLKCMECEEEAEQCPSYER